MNQECIKFICKRVADSSPRVEENLARWVLFPMSLFAIWKDFFLGISIIEKNSEFENQEFIEFICKRAADLSKRGDEKLARWVSSCPSEQVALSSQSRYLKIFRFSLGIFLDIEKNSEFENQEFIEFICERAADLSKRGE
ncbi:hypothetical protein HOLleu_24591 [Holothuria leucospilota]|uniref:Uncharacterized protein n=1 Tax=Holothuria leucospilota TaxID=206669 RepID=A0A9Q1H3R5_HOLLE|nr:hypothetical protein HOLleu_24591 [Holothuria leucospilota]